ncbi:HTH-like domain-containing protein [Gracilibacillus kekensis]|uniref:HTH-like domain-containing protein n=1 Tax=Gracilibacillus kekensis TaxID=1027249 RepID=A0A1M7QQY7_9BACI|nr:hypothetical protein [Gracilibacillus kekensis]SHN33781.1 hypothetical protein SAMN05216179_3468 [Gracilibacillus kekensis]
MSITELGGILRKMYDTAPESKKATFIHLFGIKYGAIILQNKHSTAEIVKVSGIKESYKTEVRKGINLSKYVTSKI